MIDYIIGFCIGFILFYILIQIKYDPIEQKIEANLKRILYLENKINSPLLPKFSQTGPDLHHPNDFEFKIFIHGSSIDEECDCPDREIISEGCSNPSSERVREVICKTHGRYTDCFCCNRKGIMATTVICSQCSTKGEKNGK